MTNFERIKQLTIEQTAEVMLEEDFCNLCEHNQKGICLACNLPGTLAQYCKAAAIKWLESESENNG